MNLFEEINGLVSDKIMVFKTIANIIKLETRLAGRSIVPFFATLFFMFIVLVSLWASATVLIGYLLVLAFGNTLYGLIAVVALNSGIMLFLAKFLILNLKKMSFQKSRELLSQPESKKNEHVADRIDGKDCNSGKDISASSSQI